MVRSWHSRTAWRCGFCHKVVKRIPEVFVWRSRYAQASTLLPAFVQEETPNLKLEQFEPVKDLGWGTSECSDAGELHSPNVMLMGNLWVCRE